MKHKSCRLLILRCMLGLLICGGLLVSLSAEEPSKVGFTEIQQLLKNHCVKCHGPITKEGELNLSSPAAIAQGGDSGKTVVKGDIENSLLWTRVAEGEMPPETTLDEPTRNKLKQWIEGGAHGLPDKVEPEDLLHWSFRKLKPAEQFNTGSDNSLPID